MNVWARFVGFAGRGCRKILSAFAVAGNWIVHSRRSIATMAACLFVGAAFGHSSIAAIPASRSSIGQRRSRHRLAAGPSAGTQRASKLAGDVAAAHAK